MTTNASAAPDRERLSYDAFAAHLSAAISLGDPPRETATFEGLALDSIEVFELLTIVEDDLGALISDSALESITTFGDLYSVYLQS